MDCGDSAETQAKQGGKPTVWRSAAHRNAGPRARLCRVFGTVRSPAVPHPLEGRQQWQTTDHVTVMVIIAGFAAPRETVASRVSVLITRLVGSSRMRTGKWPLGSRTTGAKCTRSVRPRSLSMFRRTRPIFICMALIVGYLVVKWGMGW